MATPTPDPECNCKYAGTDTWSLQQRCTKCTERLDALKHKYNVVSKDFQPQPQPVTLLWMDIGTSPPAFPLLAEGGDQDAHAIALQSYAEECDRRIGELTNRLTYPSGQIPTPMCWVVNKVLCAGSMKKLPQRQAVFLPKDSPLAAILKHHGIIDKHTHLFDGGMFYLVEIGTVLKALQQLARLILVAHPVPDYLLWDLFPNQPPPSS
jgi:hypothetical protein